MNTQLFTVSKSNELPVLSLQFAWLPDMGFVPEALVQAIPETGGIRFVLCNENITKYNELSRRTKEMGGKLIQVGSIVKGNNQYSSISLTLGQNFRVNGFYIGNRIVAHYDYGIVKVQTLPEARYYSIGNFFSKRQGRVITNFQLQAKWLEENGFVPDVLAIATAEPGRITITLWDGFLEKYSELVKQVRANGQKLIQVGKINKAARIGITGAFLAKAGFAPDDIFSADASHGLIKLQKLDFSV